MVKKYEFTGEELVFAGRTPLRRIRAVRDFGDVKAGDFGAPEPARAAAEAAPDDGFPHGEVLVTAEMAATFLGLNATHKFPNKAVLRLANEGKLRAPVRVGDKSPRWQAEWIREYKKRLIEEGA